MTPDGQTSNVLPHVTESPRMWSGTFRYVVLPENRYCAQGVYLHNKRGVKGKQLD